jgi:hypothetical protein
MSLIQNEVNAKCFDRSAKLPFGLRLKDFEMAMQDVYDFFYDVNLGLIERGLHRLDDMLRPAILSGVLSDMLTASLAKHSRSLTVNLYHNGHPDLVVNGIYSDNRARAPGAWDNPRLFLYSLSLFHRPLNLTAGFARLDGLPAVMLLLAFSQPKLNLRKASLGEIDAERDECEPLLLRLAEKLVDLLAVKEQLPGAERFVIHDVAVAVGTDVAMVKKYLTIPHAGVTIL